MYDLLFFSQKRTLNITVTKPKQYTRFIIVANWTSEQL